MRVLVLGGAGFLGRHVVAALEAHGHAVTIGLRRPRRAQSSTGPRTIGRQWRVTRFERLTAPQAWGTILDGIDAVANCVGILRERGRETYDRVHREAPAALAAACARHGIKRLVHVSALGLRDDARSRFIRSKLAGERALRAFGDSVTIARPSLLAGDGGYGTRWIARVARWPVHAVPIDAAGRIAVIDVRDAGEAIAILCTAPGTPKWRDVELGGSVALTMADYVSALRAAEGSAPALRIDVPAWCARLASHACDFLHVSPFSFGHLELLRHDNVASPNRLAALLGRAPRPAIPEASTPIVTIPNGRTA
ncbi:MAG: NAD-dependent epimerase/dehydratase family protein [Casimicrobiaceae bacterium]